MKDGKKPINNKVNYSVYWENEDFGNRLSISPELKKSLESQGFEYRFVDSKQLIANSNYHKEGWIAYVKQTDDTIDSGSDFQVGTDPDGNIRRGTVVLAIRPKSLGDKHRAKLEQKRLRYNAENYNKSQASELKQLAAERNVRVDVHEGYDENE